MLYRFIKADYESTAAQQPELQEGGRLSKEEYAAMKKAERERWTRAGVNAQAEEVFRDDESMRGFFNFMAQCTPQSTRNLLLLYEQDPSITQPRTVDRWKEAGRSIRIRQRERIYFLCRSGIPKKTVP